MVRLNSIDIANAIEKEMRKTISKKLRAIQNVLNIRIRNLVEKTFLDNIPEITGQSYYELGIPDINQRLRIIAQEIAHNVYLRVDQSIGLLFIEIGILRSDYSDLLSLPESVFYYSGDILPWLRWLLLDGNTDIVLGYSFDDSLNVKSRTGGGIMTPGGNWKIPSELAGTINDNILTRALGDLEKRIEETIINELKGLL